MNSFIENVNYVASLDKKYGTNIEIFKNNLSLRNELHNIKIKFQYYSFIDKKIHEHIFEYNNILIEDFESTLLNFKSQVLLLGFFTCDVSFSYNNFIINNIATIDVKIYSTNNDIKTYDLNINIKKDLITVYDIYGDVNDTLKILPVIALLDSSFIDGVFTIKENIDVIQNAEANAIIASEKAVESLSSSNIAIENATISINNASVAISSSNNAEISAELSLTSANTATEKASEASLSSLSSFDSAALSSTKATESSNSANDALTSKNKAEKWSSELENVEVESGKYSAMHWAIKASISASGSAYDISYDNTSSGLTSDNVKAAIDELDTSIISKQDLLVSGNNIRTINNTSIIGPGNIEITAGSGGYSANVYLTSLVSSTVPSYNQLSYTPDVAESTISVIVDNNEVLMADYIFDGDVVTASVPAGEWTFHYHSRVSNTSATSFIRFELFKRSNIGVETILFSTTSISIENTVYAQSILTVTQPAFATDLTDKIGIRVYGSTTRTNNTIIDMLVGDGSSSYFSTPLQIRHNQTRDRSAQDSHPIGSITNLQAELDNRVVKNTDITSGTNTKITYDAKGLVTSATSLSATDIPVLDASKITTGTIAVLRGGTGVTTSTGSGNNVLSTSPVLTTPSLGVATGTSFNAITGLAAVAPLDAGIASIGTSTAVARQDHKHAVQTTVLGNAGTATTLQTARTITIGNTGKTFDGSANVSFSISDIGAQPIDADLTAISALVGTTGLLKKTATDAWILDTNTYVTSSGVTSIATSGAITGGTITSTGTISHSTTDGYLHVPATGTTSNGKVLTAGATAGSFSWATPTSGVTDHTLLTNIGTNTHAQIDTALTRLVNTSGTNTGDQTIALTGDITGTGTGTFITTLKNTGTAGTYKSVTTDSQGRVTGGTNPTTISGFGISDAYTKIEVDNITGDINSALDAINGEVI